MKNNKSHHKSDSELVAQVGSEWRSRACITLKEASFLLSTPVSQLRKLCRRGELNPVTGLGRKWRLRTEDIDRMLNKTLRNHIPAQS